VELDGYGFSELTFASCYQRQLHHVVNPSSRTSGSMVSVPPPGSIADSLVCAAGNTSLHPHGLLPVVGASSVLICCSSVFSPTKWVSRSLSIRELGDAFDLPQAYLPLFDGISASRSHSLPFLIKCQYLLSALHSQMQ
jgi:hypothetical protein